MARYSLDHIGTFLQAVTSHLSTRRRLSLQDETIHPMPGFQEKWSANSKSGEFYRGDFRKNPESSVNYNTRMTSAFLPGEVALR
jgi:hypothetical protein